MQELYLTPMGQDEALVRFAVHPSVFAKSGDMRHEILTDVMGPLVTFPNEELVAPCVITYFVLRPFEYFPCVRVEREGAEPRFWSHGNYDGWAEFTEQMDTPLFVGQGAVRRTIGEMVAEVFAA